MKRLDDGTGRSADSADQTDFKSQIQNHQSQMGAQRLGAVIGQESLVKG